MGLVHPTVEPNRRERRLYGASYRERSKKAKALRANGLRRRPSGRRAAAEAPGRTTPAPAAGTGRRSRRVRGRPSGSGGLPRVRFLLADDAVAGKTITAGLLVRELHRVDDGIGRVAADVESGGPDADGRLAMAESRHRELLARRERRRGELQQQRALSLQGVERITSVALLPHPDRTAAEVRRHQPDPRTEATAMRVVMDHERERGRRVEDVSANNVGYDDTSLDPVTGSVRLIEVKGTWRRYGHGPDAAQRALGLGGPARLLLVGRRHRLRANTGSPGTDSRAGPLPVARGEQMWQHYYLTVDAIDGPDASVEGVGRIAKQLRHDRAGASMIWVWSYRDLSPRSTRRVVA